MSNDDKRLDSVLSQLDDLKVQLKDAQAEAEQARYERSTRWKVPRRNATT